MQFSERALERISVCPAQANFAASFGLLVVIMSRYVIFSIPAVVHMTVVIFTLTKF
jgi:hypothetical protein